MHDYLFIKSTGIGLHVYTWDGLEYICIILSYICYNYIVTTIKYLRTLPGFGQSARYVRPYRRQHEIQNKK